MSTNETAAEEDNLDPVPEPLPSTKEKTPSEALVPDLPAASPQTNDEKVTEWMTQSVDAEKTSTGEKEDEGADAIVDHDQGETTNPDNTSGKLLSDEVSGKDVTTITTNVSTPDGHRSILRRLYHSQVSPSQEPHMRALTSQRILSRDLRRVASASTPPAPAPVVE